MRKTKEKVSRKGKEFNVLKMNGSSIFVEIEKIKDNEMILERVLFFDEGLFVRRK